MFSLLLKFEGKGEGKKKSHFSFNSSPGQIVGSVIKKHSFLLMESQRRWILTTKTSNSFPFFRMINDGNFLSKKHREMLLMIVINEKRGRILREWNQPHLSSFPYTAIKSTNKWIASFISLRLVSIMEIHPETFSSLFAFLICLLMKCHCYDTWRTYTLTYVEENSNDIKSINLLICGHTDAVSFPNPSIPWKKKVSL